MKKRMNRLALVLGLSFVLSLTACGTGDEGTESTSSSTSEAGSEVSENPEYPAVAVEETEYNEENLLAGYQDFSFKLFKNCAAVSSDENIMISPTSVMMAMEMTEAGAAGTTSEEITQMICPDANREEVQSFAADMVKSMNKAEDVEMNVANSVWINQDYEDIVNPNYVSYLEDTFGALATTAPFDNETVEDINSWVSDETNGMVDHVIDNLESNPKLVLINAIAFEGEWASKYEDTQIGEEDFNNADGSTSTVSMLNGSAEVYYETDQATGFIQYYAGEEYAFVAMLPTENQSANKFAQNLTAENFREFIDSASTDYEVYTKIPEFTNEYEIELNDILAGEMGMPSAFSQDTADFSNMFTLEKPDIFIELVYHKTFIDVNREGTRAAAVTVVEMNDECIAEPSETKEVYLDRPFVYAIVDTETMTPVFIGTVNNL